MVSLLFPVLKNKFMTEVQFPVTKDVTITASNLLKSRIISLE